MDLFGEKKRDPRAENATVADWDALMLEFIDSDEKLGEFAVKRGLSPRTVYTNSKREGWLPARKALRIDARRTGIKRIGQKRAYKIDKIIQDQMRLAELCIMPARAELERINEYVKGGGALTIYEALALAKMGVVIQQGLLGLRAATGNGGPGGMHTATAGSGDRDLGRMSEPALDAEIANFEKMFALGDGDPREVVIDGSATDETPE